MILISGILLIVCACFAGGLLWSLAAHALPLWCGGLAALLVNQAGGGLVASALAGLAAATATIIIEQLLNAVIRSPLLRLGVGLAFAIPAAIAGYHAAHAIAAASEIGEAGRAIIATGASMSTAIAARRGICRPRCLPPSARPEQH